MNLNKKRKKIMRKKKTDGLLLIIDGSNLSHRAYRKFSNLSTKEGRHTGLIYGFFRMLHAYLIRFHPVYCIIVFDSHRSKQSNFRNKLLGSYKQHRGTLDAVDYVDFNYQVRVVRRLLKLLNIPYVWDYSGLGHEADDYIAWLALNHKGRVNIISSDKDFCQLICKNIKVFNPFRDALINEVTCQPLMGYSPSECVDYLSLLGDHSDDIPGYRGMGPVKIRKFLDEFGSIQNFMNTPDAEFKGIDRDALELVKDRNYKLIDMRYALTQKPFEFPPIHYSKTNKIERVRIKIYLKRFHLNSFMMKDFMQPFKKLKIWNQTNLEK